MTLRTVLSLTLLLFLIVVMPLWGWLDMRRLKRLDSSAARTRSYVVTIMTLWALSLLVILAIPAHLLWNGPAALVTRTDLARIPPSALTGIIGGLLIGLLMPVLMARLKPSLMSKQMAPVRFMLPTSRSQRWLFALVCFSAGICEEWIYRGFLLHFMVDEWPTLPGGMVLAAAAALFGMAHVYQGLLGTIVTTALGILFITLYLSTGNLLLSMAIHGLIDLRILLLLPKAQPAAEAAG